MPLLKPTLQGLRDLQSYFEYQGFSLPVVTMDVCQNRPEEAGRVVTLVQEIANDGPHREVTNVRLSMKEDDEYRYYLEFTDIQDCGHCHHGMDGHGVMIHLFGRNNPPFAAFVQANAERILNIARWGRPKIPFSNRIGMWCKGK